MRKGTKRHPNWKVEVKLTVCVCYGLIHRNPKDSTPKLLELISEFSQVEGYTIQKLICISVH